MKQINFAIHESAKHVHGTANRQPKHTHFFHFEICILMIQLAHQLGIA